MDGLVVSVSLALAILLFAAAVVDLLQTWGKKETATKAVVSAVETISKEDGSGNTLKAQSGVDVAGAWEALASLATALKDLDRSSRLFMMSLAFLAVAAAGAGIGAVADAIAKP